MGAMVLATRAEPGCIDFAYAFDLLDPHLVRVSERWESRAALAQHQTSAHIGVWRAQGPSLGVTDRSLRLYEATPEPL
jgi:quinol monooxygenase YgiN